MTLAQVHALALVLLLLAFALCLWRWERVLGAVIRYFTEPTSALSAAGMRIVIFAYLWSVQRVGAAASYANLPASTRKLPHGWRWLGEGWLFDPAIAAGAEQALIVASACAVLGLLTRVSVPTAALLSVYVLGLPNFFVKINHGSHVLVLCALALAFSPCGDALSLDRLVQRWRGRPAPEPSQSYALPVRLCWLLLGTVYLFPGLWKLWQSGDLWSSGVQLKAELYAKWADLDDFVPLFRPDGSDALLALLGTATLVFEIGFIFALFSPYARVIASLAAVAFHFGIWKVMAIRFHVFLPLILLLDFPRLPQLVRHHAPALYARLAAVVSTLGGTLDRLLRRPAAPPVPARARTLQNALVAGVGGSLFVLQLIVGFAGIDTFPVAVHPRFSNRKTSIAKTVKRPHLELLSVSGEKRDLTLELQRFGKARSARLLKSLASGSGEAAEQRARSAVSVLESQGLQLQPGDRLELHELRWDLMPLGERKNLTRKHKASLVVTQSGALEGAAPEREP